MVATSGSARLVSATDLPDSAAVTATVPRAEIEEALHDDAPPRLSLQVVQSTDGAESRHELGVEWERADLERVLESSTSETVTLAFVRRDLESALIDVEAHGVRVRAAIFTVAVAATAGGVAAAGNAMPMDPAASAAPAAVLAAPDIISDAGSGGGLVQSSASDSLVSDAGSGGGLVQSSASDSLVSDAGSGGGLVQSSASDSLVSDAGSGGGLVQSSASDSLVSDAGSGGGLVQSSASDSLVSDAGSGGGLVQSSASDSLVSDAGSGGGLVQPAGADAMVSDAGTGGPMPITDDGSSAGGFSIPAPDPATTGMVAGMGLLIAGAAFTIRRRDTHRPV